jgi:hypothetical protein
MHASKHPAPLTLSLTRRAQAVGLSAWSAEAYGWMRFDGGVLLRSPHTAQHNTPRAPICHTLVARAPS